MSQNMKTLLPNNFRRKCWKVTAYLELFWVATGGRNFTGGAPLCCPPWNRLWAVDGRTVTFGTVRRGLGKLRPRPVPSSLYQM